MTAADEAYDRLHGPDGFTNLAGDRSRIECAECTECGEHSPTDADECPTCTRGCDCTELCSMGPTCPGGMLARIPGTGCWRKDGSADADAEVAGSIMERARRVRQQIETGACLCADEPHLNLLHDLAVDLAVHEDCRGDAVTPRYTPASLAAAYNEGWNAACDYLSNDYDGPDDPPNPYEVAALPAEQEGSADDLYGMELDRRLTAERTVAAVLEVVEMYESCGPKQQSTRDVLAAVRAAALPDEEP